MTTVSEGPTGTFPYMAPEMFIEGHRETAVDIYALGCAYIELMGQRRVWPRMGGMEIMHYVLIVMSSCIMLILFKMAVAAA